MATPSPRKFQEKIALLQQRELEGKIEFEQIMTDVQGLTRAPKATPQPKQHLQIQQQHHHLQQHPSHPHQQQHAPRPPQGGSLPDFSINLPQGRGPSYYHQGSLQGAVQEVQDLREAVYHGSNCTPHQRTSTATQVRHHPHTSNLSTSPRLHYPSPLLSPPEVLPRSNSDSSLHQNLVQGKMVVSNRKVSAPAEMRTEQGFGMQFYTHELQPRPKSGCETTLPGDATTINHIQRSPNIPIPAAINNVGGAGPGGGVAGGGGGGGGGVGQLPNTGSLPDLTQVQYLQPMNPPLPDTDTVNLANLTAGSPRLGSGFTAGSLKDHYNSSGQASPRGTSPGPSPSLNRKQKQKPYQTIYPNRGSHHTPSKNHLSVPTVINARYLHKCKGMTVVDNSSTTVDTHLANSGFNIFGQPLSPNSSHPASPGMTIDNSSTTVDTHRANSGLNIFGQPLSPNNSHPASPNHLSFLEYRNPVSPQLSPRSSPGPCHTLHTGGLGSFSSNSPSDSRSAPPSPSAPQASPASSPGVSLSKTPFSYEYPTHAQTNQLNQQFEQCNMIDNSPGSNNSYTSGNTTLQQTRLMEISIESGGSGYFSNTASSSPSGPPPAYPNVSSQQLTQNLSQSVSQAHSQTHSQPSGPPPPYPQTSSSSSTHHQQSQQQSQHHQHRQQQQQPPHSSPSHPQHISQSPSHSHHPPSPVQPISSQHPPSPGQGPLSPQSNPPSIQHPPTPQTPQTPTLIPSVVLTMPDEAGTESERLLQDEMSFSEMFGSVISYEQGSFESDILENMRLDENELNMMVDQNAVDQLLVDQETEESFRRDHRSASSTSSGP